MKQYLIQSSSAVSIAGDACLSSREVQGTTVYIYPAAVYGSSGQRELCGVLLKKVQLLLKCCHT
jgi:hypothetical protein